MDLNFNMFIILSVIFISTLVRSTFGFGEALIAMPLLAFIVDLKTAVPLIAMLAGTITVMTLVTNWRSVRFNTTWRLVLSSFAGVPFGLLFLKGAYDVIVKVILAVVIVVFSVYSLLKPKRWVLKHERSSYVFGFLAGILGGAYNISGPPVVVYGTLRRWDPDSFRATLQGYFLPTWVFIVISHGVTGFWTKQVWLIYLVSVPIVFLAFVIGSRINRFMNSENYTRCIHILLITIGTFLLVRTLWKILQH